MTLEEILSVSAAIIGSVGGSAVIIVGLSSWLGKLWANRIMEKDKLEFTKELETIKSELQRESEQQKLTFSLYFEGQFKIYNDLWLALSELKHEVDKLWSSANKQNLRTFVKAVQQAKKQIRNSAILIEQEHYEQMLNSLAAFDNYKIGKERLIDARSIDRMDEWEINQVIEHNRIKRDEITRFTDLMLQDMRRQIRGQR